MDENILSRTNQFFKVFDFLRCNLNEMVLSERRAHINRVKGAPRNHFVGRSRNVLSGTGEGIDVALRIGPLEDSGLIVRKLDDIRLVVCASPDYLRRRGEPAAPDELVDQDCLAFGEVPSVAEWSFQDGAARRSLRIPTRLCVNDFDALVSAALAGAGIVRVPSWQVAHLLADGQLRIVLEAYQRPPTPLSVLTLRSRLLLPKVRAFVDFLQQRWMRSRPSL